MSWNLIGHEWAEQLLAQHIRHGDLRHAYLITGAPGTGRRSLAIELAKAVNCQDPPSPGEFCDECRTCKQLSKLQQPDLSVIESETEGAMIKVDQVRLLQHSLSLAPYEAHYRVALLRNFQLANANAQNALLKTLEEAPPQVLLILTADSAENLLPTISSRCEILRLRPLSITVLERALVQRWKFSPEDAHLFSHLSGGRPGIALTLSADKQALEKRKVWLDDFVRLFEMNLRERFAYSESINRTRDPLRSALQTWLTYSRDLYLVHSRSSSPLTNADHEAELQQLTSAFSQSDILGTMKALQDSLEALEQNANLRLLTDTLMLDLPAS